MSFSVPTSTTARCCRSLLRNSSKTPPPLRCIRLSSSACLANSRRNHSRRNSSRRWASTDVSAAAAHTNPKISGIVEQISKLTLLETADLVASLKSRLNIPDMSFAAPSSGPSSSSAAAPPPAEEEEAAPAPAAKTLFTLKLQSFEATSKPKIIKEVKSMLGLSLVDSKKFAESAPKVLREGVPKEEAEKMVKTFEALGGKVSME
ncbi:hypothetical protein GJ744_001750 [Endocarpon pusillum]|uniref:54S ribosomal protein L12 n=1 Tax=Endocarpon pusillum TaxID=364733 RepID=A0A8H7AB44_9EURO|nr:hypothetical protein GJ744_001750 [Endocarpon pusillum]